MNEGGIRGESPGSPDLRAQTLRDKKSPPRQSHMFGNVLWAPLGPMDSWPPPWVPLYVALPVWTLVESVRGVWTMEANPHGWPPTPTCYIAPVGDVEIESIILFWGSSNPACPATLSVSVSSTPSPPPPYHSV